MIAAPHTQAIPAPALKRKKPVLVTGGAGFIGCNLADRLAAQGQRVILLDSLRRPGVEANLDWLRARHGTRIIPLVADIRDSSAADVITDVSGVFHFAAQVAVTSSLADPEEDFEINLGGTLNLLEGIRRKAPGVALVFASTNKVYGELADIRLEATRDAWRPCDETTRQHGISELRPLCFHTPYGCSKGAADQYVLDYARTFGLRAAVLRMSCIYGPRQLGTEDQGWVAHFLISALKRQPITLYGDGRQVRDILEVGDAVEAYVRAYRGIDRIRGRAFNLGGGPANAVSLRQVLARIEELLGRPVAVRFADWRPGDQRYYVSDTRAIRAQLKLPEPRPFAGGIAGLADWLTRSARAAGRRRIPPAFAQARP
jgi:CDP-paratose 2-epimerase